MDAKTSHDHYQLRRLTSLPGEYVRIAARYQQDGTLVATRIWASTSFDNVWLSPEGHVLHANTTNQTSPSQRIGSPGTDAVDANTQFFLRQPWSAIADATPIGTGTAFFDRATWCAASRFTPAWWTAGCDMGGAEHRHRDRRLLRRHLAPTMTGFTYTHDYVLLPMTTWSPRLLSASSANTVTTATFGHRFKYWNFAFPHY